MKYIKIKKNKLSLVYGIILLLISNVTMAQQESVGVDFVENNWNNVIQFAKKSNKKIFVDAYTSWCGPCKVLKTKIFTQKEVGDYFNKNFINYSIDLETKEGLEFSKKWNINEYPTLLFFDKNGNLITKNIGFVDGKELLTLGKNNL